LPGYRAVLLVDCPAESDLMFARGVLARVAQAIEEKTDGATIQLSGPTEDIRTKDIHVLADETFVYDAATPPVSEPESSQKQIEERER
jgi:hypothetical protein